MGKTLERVVTMEINKAYLAGFIFSETFKGTPNNLHAKFQASEVKDL